MEIVDNAFILSVPGALAAGLADGLFWWSLALSFVIAFVLTVPVNRWLIARGPRPRRHARTPGALMALRTRRCSPATGACSPASPTARSGRAAIRATAGRCSIFAETGLMPFLPSAARFTEDATRAERRRG